MLVGGGDPGVTGGIAFIWAAAGNKTEVFKMPVSPYQVEKKDGTISNRNEPDFIALGNLFYEVANGVVGPKHFYLERPEPWGLSAYSALSLGASYACLYQAAIDHGFTVYNVRPRDWKERMGLWKKKKTDSVALAQALYPQQFYNLDKATTDGVAEALLIAHGGLITLEAQAGRR